MNFVFFNNKKNLNVFSLAAVILLSTAGMLAQVGCSGTEGPAKPVATDAQVQDMVKARKIFDESAGNWDGLSPDKKAEYTKYVGGTAPDATRWWARMKNGPGGGAQKPGVPGPGGTGG